MKPNHQADTVGDDDDEDVPPYRLETCSMGAQQAEIYPFD